MLKVSVIGATGYVGQELVRLLYSHPEVELNSITSQSYINESYSDIYNNFNELVDTKCINEEIDKLANISDVIFIALPHGIASNIINKKHLENTKIIDLGADYRLDDVNIYEEWYNTRHKSPDLIDSAVYGLCEINRNEIVNADLIANPGCYTTCSILSIAPLVQEGFINLDSIIVDAKSGVSGAGRSLNIGTHFTECNESIKAYKIASHRHTPEIEQQLSKVKGEKINLLFTPHLVPMNRGILTTSYIKLKNTISWEKVNDIYQDYYKDEYFIRILKKDKFPETRWVKGSNFVDIGFEIDNRTNTLVILGSLDNLIKGAAGQAVQNMNIVFGFEEKLGLNYIPVFPG